MLLFPNVRGVFFVYFCIFKGLVMTSKTYIKMVVYHDYHTARHGLHSDYVCSESK